VTAAGTSIATPSVRRNLTFDIVAAIGVGISIAMVWTLMPSAARKNGMEPLWLAVLISTPFIANLISGLWSGVAAKSIRQLTAYRVIGAGAVALVWFSQASPVVVLVALLLWFSLSFGGPFHIQLWGRIYPPEARGRIFGLFGVFRSSTVAIAAFIGGFLADAIGDFQALPLVGLLAVLCAFAYLGLRSSVTPEPPRYTARTSLGMLLDRPRLRRVVTAHFFYGAGLIAAIPLFALVHIDRLDLTLGQVGIIGVVGSLGTTLSYPIWGVIVDRIGSMVALRLGVLCGFLGVAGYALAGDFLILLPASALVGAAGACTDAAVLSVLAEETPVQDRASALAGWNLTTGFHGIGAPLLVSLLIGAGILAVDSALVLCTAVCGFGVLLYFLIGTGTGAAARRRSIRMRGILAGRLIGSGRTEE